MPTSHSPIIVCRLTDKNGKILNPYDPNAISFTELCSSKKCPGDESSGENKLAAILISGYVAVFAEGRELSEPIPFHMVRHVCIFAPEGAFLNFTVTDFTCFGVPVMAGTDIGRVRVSIGIKAAVRSCADVDILLHPAAFALCASKICINVLKVYDCADFSGETCVFYELLLPAKVLQYNALSDGVKNSYTNADELTQYGSVGILSPNSVSYYNLFINAILQPSVNYTMAAGQMDLLTDDVPPEREPVIIAFAIFGKNHGRAVYVTNDTCVFASDGTKRIFTDSDELTQYGDKGIPAPDAVSYFNLFINGALQPQVNYTVQAGVLELTTANIPPAGSMIVLESLTIKDSAGNLISVDTYEYNAYSQGNKIYTDYDEIAMYGDGGISDPKLCSYLNLFVNGVLQPQINYSVQEGLLTLTTTDTPINRAPVTLQFVRVYVT